MERSYEVYASSGALVLGGGVRSLTRRVRGEGEFGGDRGFGETGREAIRSLDLGETWASGNHGSYLRVRHVAGPSTRKGPLGRDRVAEGNGDYEGDMPIYEESRGNYPDVEHRIVDPRYFTESGGYSPEAIAIAGNLGVGETWIAGAIGLERVR